MLSFLLDMFRDIVKPVYNDHLYNKNYPLWFIQ